MTQWAELPFINFALISVYIVELHVPKFFSSTVGLASANEVFTKICAEAIFLSSSCVQADEIIVGSAPWQSVLLP